MHMHVGLLGDEHPEWGVLKDEYRQRLEFKVFMLFAGIKEDEVSDQKLRQVTENIINTCQDLDHVVCLALDPVYDNQGQRREDLSLMWVANEYVLDLQRTLGEKVLFGASVHPYDPSFKERVNKYIDKDAVFIKWLPSSQQINLADDRVREAITFLTTARRGKPLPLLLHVGPEYAIPSTDPRTTSYDFLSWTFWDKLGNLLRGNKKWFTPQIKKIHENLKTGLSQGAVIIFAHLGLPYYAPHWLGRIFEHSDFKIVQDYLEKFPVTNTTNGRCYADLSACVTPFRRSYFPDIRKLPPESLLFGSDYPTPVFELSADIGEMMDDLKAILEGNLQQIIVPEDNLLSVNLRELQHFFPDHPMFFNFNALL